MNNNKNLIISACKLHIVHIRKSNIMQQLREWFFLGSNTTYSSYKKEKITCTYYLTRLFLFYLMQYSFTTSTLFSQKLTKDTVTVFFCASRIIYNETNFLSENWPRLLSINSNRKRRNILCYCRISERKIDLQIFWSLEE